jgi:A/G-specific adenine glycosylase
VAVAAEADARRPVAPHLLEWARVHGRHNLPWQQPATPYRVWISEIMLQQTQVNTVIPYFERFIGRFPDLATLASAPLEDVLALWSGLGYYARARNLHRAALMCCEQHAGHLPESLDALTALPGIGRSTAGAIMALGFGERAPILDGNVKRVLARYHAIEGWPGKTAVMRTLWDWAERETPDDDVAAYTQAIMDLGATLCTRRRPACDLCPIAAWCTARLQGNQAAYPGPKPKRTRPQREAIFAWVEADGLVLFEQRPPSGIWGGLLCLPEMPASLNVETWCCERLGLTPNTVAKQPGFEHEFTHFRLAAGVLKIEPEDSKQIRDDSMLRWLRPEAALSTGLPAPIRRYIETRLSEIRFESEVET